MDNGDDEKDGEDDGDDDGVDRVTEQEAPSRPRGPPSVCLWNSVVLCCQVLCSILQCVALENFVCVCLLPSPRSVELAALRMCYPPRTLLQPLPILHPRLSYLDICSL